VSGARREVVVVATGLANLASVEAALARCDAHARPAQGPDDVEAAARVVMPGVGAFGAAMERLAADGLVEPLRRRIAAGRPTLAVCLGLQLLLEGSEESPGVRGLGVAAGIARGFAPPLTVPHMGWNRVDPDPGCRWLEPGHAYFANSFRLVEPPPGWRVARCAYGGPFVAALERGGVLACQFHPELSGPWGGRLLTRWLAEAPAAAAAREAGAC
jgi:imidazole glycerol phosphate synthase glutamine amidotransferase subunit